MLKFERAEIVKTKVTGDIGKLCYPELRKYLFNTNTEETGRRGTLNELVSHLNLRYGTKDIAED